MQVRLPFLILAMVLFSSSLSYAKNCHYKFLSKDKILNQGKATGSWSSFALKEPAVECFFEKAINEIQAIECKNPESKNAYGTIFYRNLKNVGKTQKFVVEIKGEAFRLEYSCT